MAKGTRVERAKRPGRRRRGPARLPAALTLLLLLAVAADAFAGRDPEPGLAHCRPTADEGTLMIDLELVSLFTDEVRETLSSGFTSTVATRLALVEAVSGRLVAENRYSREVKYDVWDETYLVTTYSDQGTGRQLAATLDEVEEHCRRVNEFRFCPLERLREGESYRIAVEVLLVPISQEQLEQTKRWVKESGQTAGEGDDRSGLGIFFGSMMDIFIGRSTGVEEDRFTFVSEPFELAEVEVERTDEVEVPEQEDPDE
jgi:hypothetical protein